MMTLLDEYTRQSLAIQVERQLTATQVLAVLERAMARYGVPGYIRSDNGPESGQLHYKWPCDKILAKYLLSHPALSRLV